MVYYTYYTRGVMLWESCILVYKLLVVLELIVVEYIGVDRTGVNVYWIRIKLQ